MPVLSDNILPLYTHHKNKMKISRHFRNAMITIYKQVSLFYFPTNISQCEPTISRS